MFPGILHMLYVYFVFIKLYIVWLSFNYWIKIMRTEMEFENKINFLLKNDELIEMELFICNILLIFLNNI